MFECDDPLYIAERNMRWAMKDAREAASYASADADRLKRENQSLHDRVAYLEKAVDYLYNLTGNPFIFNPPSKRQETQPAKLKPKTVPPVNAFIFHRPQVFDCRLWLEWAATEEDFSNVLNERGVELKRIAGYIQGVDLSGLDDECLVYVSSQQASEWLKQNKPEWYCSNAYNGDSKQS